MDARAQLTLAWTVDLAREGVRQAFETVTRTLAFLDRNPAGANSADAGEVLFWLGTVTARAISASQRMCDGVSKLTGRPVAAVEQPILTGDPESYLREARRRLADAHAQLDRIFRDCCDEAVLRIGDRPVLSDEDLRQLLDSPGTAGHGA